MTTVMTLFRVLSICLGLKINVSVNIYAFEKKTH